AVHAQRGQRVAVAGVGALSGLLPGGQVEGDDLVGVAVLAGALVLLGGDVQLVLAHGEPRALLDLGDAVAAGRVVVAGGGDAGAQLAGLVVDGEEVGDAAAVAGGVADVGGHDQRVGGHDARVLDALAHLVLGDHLPGLRVDGLDVQLALGVRAALAHGDQLRAAAVAGVGRLGRPRLRAAADLPGGAAAGAAGGDGVTADGDVVEADRAGAGLGGLRPQLLARLQVDRRDLGAGLRLGLGGHGRLVDDRRPVVVGGVPAGLAHRAGQLDRPQLGALVAVVADDLGDAALGVHLVGQPGAGDHDAGAVLGGLRGGHLEQDLGGGVVRRLLGGTGTAAGGAAVVAALGVRAALVAAAVG